MSNIKLDMTEGELTKWWCHGELAKDPFWAAAGETNVAQAARNIAWVEAALERFQDAYKLAQATGNGIEIGLSSTQATVAIHFTAQLIAQFKQACSNVEPGLIFAYGGAILVAWDKIVDTFPRRLAPSGNETEKP